MTKGGTKKDASPGSGWGFLTVMRYLERRAGNKPRIGKSRRVAEDIVDMGQDPYTGFAYTELSELDLESNPPKVRPRFLGFFGPFGPLPHAITREVDLWTRNGDRAFVRFADIFVARFQQLFYRSWSDARPITQFDHPSGGTFPRFLRALTGDASPAFDDTSAVHDVVRLRHTALLSGRVRSPTRLRQALNAHFRVPTEVEEFVTSWLNFSPEDLSMMGQQGMALGRNMRLGDRAPSISEKIIVHLRCPSLDVYRSFLPGRHQQAELRDLILSYTGGFLEVDVALWLPRHEIRPAQLGSDTQLGWTSAMPMAQIDDGEADFVRASQYQITLEETFA